MIWAVMMATESLRSHAHLPHLGLVMVLLLLRNHSVVMLLLVRVLQSV
jgi:hypothetical protein